jgi:predicted ATPase
MSKLLSEFRRLYGDAWLDLAEVDDAEARRFVDALLESEPNRLGEGFRQALSARCGGHPLFTVELLRAMQERGDLVRDAAGRWREGPALDWHSLPARVEAVIAERIERLGQEQRDILTIASVEGEDFTAEVVAHVRSMEPRVMVRRLSGELQKEHRLVRSRGLRRVMAGRLALYRFQHYLFQQYLYSSLDEGERAYLHEDVGCALEALYGGQTGEAAVQLARHFLEAGVTDKAAHYFGRAGKLAAERYANEEAVAHLSRALELAPEMEPVERFTLLLAREAVYDLLGQRDAQREDLVGLEELAQGLGAEQKAEVAERQSRYARRMGDYERAVAAARTSVLQAQAARQVRLQVKGHYRWGAALYRQGDYAGAQAQYEEMLTLARSAGQRSAEAMALSNLGIIIDDLDDSAGVEDRQRDFFERALYLFRQAGDQLGELKAMNGLGLSACCRGDFATAWAHLGEFLRLSVKVGSRKSEELARGNFGHLCDLLGDHTRARRFLEQCLHISREIEAPYSESRAFLYLAMASQCRSHLGEARSFAEQALRLSQRIGAPDVEVWALHYLGAVHMDTGDLGAARTAFRESLALLPSLESLAGHAGVALAQGNLGEAQSKVAEILAELDGGKPPDCFYKPSWIYLICYHVLEAADEPRATEVLVTAHRLLMNNAARTPDDRLRRSYLENVPWNREIVRLAQARRA